MPTPLQSCTEAMYLTRYASKVYIIHRFDYLEASKTMQKRVLANPKIEILYQHEVIEAFGNEKGLLGGVKVSKNLLLHILSASSLLL
jgi:thioredoxin reductase (NADPH)